MLEKNKHRLFRLYFMQELNDYICITDIAKSKNWRIAQFRRSKELVEK